MKNRYALPRLRRYHYNKISPFQIITIIVPDFFGITIEELNSKTNEHCYSKRRHLLMVILARHTFLPHNSIGIFFGYRDHVMVSHASRFVENLEYIFKKTAISDPYLDEFNKLDLKYTEFKLNPNHSDKINY